MIANARAFNHEGRVSESAPRSPGSSLESAPKDYGAA